MLDSSDTLAELETKLRAHRAGGWIRTVQRARDEGADYATLYFAVFQSKPTLLYTAAEYARRRGVRVLLADDEVDFATPSPEYS